MIAGALGADVLDEYVYEAMRAGASGFLLKDVAPDDLVQAVRVVERGDALLARRSPAGCSSSSRAAPRPARPRRSSPT